MPAKSADFHDDKNVNAAVHVAHKCENYSGKSGRKRMEKCTA